MGVRGEGITGLHTIAGNCTHKLSLGLGGMCDPHTCVRNRYNVGRVKVIQEIPVEGPISLVNCSVESLGMAWGEP